MEIAESIEGLMRLTPESDGISAYVISIVKNLARHRNVIVDINLINGTRSYIGQSEDIKRLEQDILDTLQKEFNQLAD